MENMMSFLGAAMIWAFIFVVTGFCMGYKARD